MSESYLPQTGEGLNLIGFVQKQQPDYTYKLDVDRECIRGMTDKADAVLQAIYLMLSTERYQYPIYSYNYGVEFEDLIGQPKDFVMSEVKRRITEALMQDDRINSVDSWEFESTTRAIIVSFVVHTIYGDVETTKGVNV